MNGDLGPESNVSTLAAMLRHLQIFIACLYNDELHLESQLIKHRGIAVYSNFL